MTINRRQALGTIGAVAAVPTVSAASIAPTNGEWTPDTWVYLGTDEVTPSSLGRAVRILPNGTKEVRSTVRTEQQISYEKIVEAKDTKVVRDHIFPECETDDERLQHLLKAPLSDEYRLADIMKKHVG